ncbi:MAG: MlaD family protein [Nitrospinota bacterium]|nr:MlaD family protein [Nitrospinota bacterium]MDP7368961.1 MlaD family protein [Nitrospinota bacterium]
MPENTGNQVKVGLFVAAGLGIFALFIVSLMGLGLGGSKDTYSVLFKTVAGLENGSIVRLGGLKVGRVENVGISVRNARMAEAVISVNTGTPIRRDSRVLVTSVGVTGSMYLSITLGSPDAPLFRPGSVLRGQEAASFQDVINEAQGVASRMNKVLGGLDETAQLVFSDIQKLVRSARTKFDTILGATGRAVARVENILSEENERTITRFLASLGKAADRLEKNIGPAVKEFQLTLQRVRKSLAQVDRTADSFTKLAGDSSDFVAELKGRLSAADRLLARFDRVGEGLEKVLASGEKAVGELTGALKSEVRIVREELQKEIAATGSAVRGEISGVGDQAKSTLRKGGASLDNALRAVEGVATRVDGFLVTNQNELRGIILNFGSLSKRLNTILLQISGGEEGERLKGAAEELRLAMGRARSLLTQLDDTVAGHREDIQILITDLRETASNLSEFTATIKDRPSSIILSAPAAPRTFK